MYWLKQLLRAWYHRIDLLVIKNNFCKSMRIIRCTSNAGEYLLVTIL